MSGKCHHAYRPAPLPLVRPPLPRQDVPLLPRLGARGARRVDAAAERAVWMLPEADALPTLGDELRQAVKRR